MFGTDGVRGVANEPPMTPEVALRLGRAIAYVARAGTTRPPRIVIGKDTRVSCYMLETALAAGICAMGGRVILCGPVPTPAVAHLLTSMRADAGVVISASHNPFSDNGIKIFGADGFKLPDHEEADIERLMESNELEKVRPTGEAVGRAERIEDARGRYTVFCKSTVPKQLTLDGVRVVVDAANGAAYRVASPVFAELGADVTALGIRPNGRNINAGCGALHPEGVVAEVRKQNAHIGVALDGDADRVILVDEKGQVVDGDAVMALCAKRMLAEHTLAKRTLVATVMSNLGLERAMEEAGGRLVRTAVGDRYVVEEMRKHGYNLGGEQSGHLVFLDHASTGDGLVAALQVLALMVSSGRSLSELSETVMHRVPQVLKNVTLAARLPIETMATLVHRQAQIEKKLGKKGRVLVRWSGTEPKLRVMVEGESTKQISDFADDLIEAARADVQAVTELRVEAYRASGLTRTFASGAASRAALRGLDFSVEEGDFVAVAGPSGSGKSTLLAVLGGLDRGYTGSVRFFGDDLGGLGEKHLAALRNERIGFVFQAFHLLPHATVLENVALPSLFASASAADDLDRARAALDRVGLLDRADESPAVLSGGQRQRVAIARAIARGPKVLLCDEPTGNLDRATGERIIELIASLHDGGATVVAVTHDDRLMGAAKRTVTLVDGAIAVAS
jgi:phosphoglucosamine mutase